MIGLGKIGIRSRQMAVGDAGEAVEAAAELDELGFGALWMNPGPVFERGRAFANVAERLVLATSVASIWQSSPAELSASYFQLADRYPGRILLGIGVSHAPIVETFGTGRTYSKPVSSMNNWLDELDSLDRPVPVEDRIIAAIWPRMLSVAGSRSLGSHPYLVPAAHSRAARSVLGDGAALAPAHCVVLEDDPDAARAIARSHLANPYLNLPNYANAWLRHGFDAEDLRDGGSNRLIDALVAWGDADTIAARIGEHLEAGADHVALQVLPEDGTFPRRAWRELACSLGTGEPTNTGRTNG